VFCFYFEGMASETAPLRSKGSDFYFLNAKQPSPTSSLSNVGQSLV
jgi:hypothetical protein